MTYISYREDTRMSNSTVVPGTKLGLLTVVDISIVNNRPKWICTCKCGNNITLTESELYEKRSCGCFNKKAYVSPELKEEILAKAFTLNKQGLTKKEIINNLEAEYDFDILHKVVNKATGFIVHHKTKLEPKLKAEILTRAFELNKEGLSRAQIIPIVEREYSIDNLRSLIYNTRGFINHWNTSKPISQSERGEYLWYEPRNTSSKSLRSK